jgi:hypothetical protein
MSRMLIMDSEGRPSLILDDYDVIYNVNAHTHSFNDEDVCTICTVTRLELQQVKERY